MPLKDVIRLEGDRGNGYLIGLDDYPLFDEAYRVPLNQQIIRQYWNREIGLETISLFKFAMKRKLWQIMPLYNQVYLSTKLKFDPLSTFDLTTLRDDSSTESGQQDGTQNSTNSSSSKGRNTHLETPQTELAGDADYASSADVSQAESAGAAGAISSNTSKGETKLAGKSTTSGRQGSASDLLLKYRQTLINTDMMVVNECNDLFMNIWDNGEEFSSGYGYQALGGIY